MPKNCPNLAATVSTALPRAKNKLHAPSALRNRAAIVEAIRDFMPMRGKALEIASGTGEHVPCYGAAFPNIMWQPSDIEQDRLQSIAAWTADSGLGNICAPVFLNAAKGGWAAEHSGQDVIILSNLLHLISAAKAQIVIEESAKALLAGGIFLIYGPFLRGAEFASAGDQNFHESLRIKHSDIGYKSFQEIQSVMISAGLKISDPIEMPSHNLILIGRKA